MLMRALPLVLLAGGAQGFVFAPHGPGTRLMPRTRFPPASSPRAARLANDLARSGLVTGRRTPSTAPTMMAGGKLGRLMAEPDPPPENVLRAVEKAGYRVTVADVASGAGVSLSEAKTSLTVLAQLAGGDLEVSADGELVYRFDGSFRSQLSSRSVKKQIQETWDKVAPVAFYLFRVSFGGLSVCRPRCLSTFHSLGLLYRRVLGLGHVCMTRCVHMRLRVRAYGPQRPQCPHAARTNHAHMHAHTHTGVALLSSIALIFTAILVLSSSSSKDERRSESRGFGFGDVMLARGCFHTFQIILLYFFYIRKPQTQWHKTWCCVLSSAVPQTWPCFRLGRGQLTNSTERGGRLRGGHERVAWPFAF